MAESARTEQQDSSSGADGGVQETRLRFQTEYLRDGEDRYDSRDVERILKDDALVGRYLAWRLGVVDDTLKMIDDSLQWRKELQVNDLTESSIPSWMFESGAVYLHGYDKEGNKLLWFKVKLHVKDTKTAVDKKRYVAFWMERYAKREPGMPLTVVFDMSDSGISNIDMDFVKYIITCFKVYYPQFLSKMILYEMPWIMNAAWKIVKTWLGPEAISKLKFVNKSEVQNFIDVEHLPAHMGGTDQYRYSYPPLPDDDFQSPICENGPIISEDESEIKDTESECKESLDLSFSTEQTLRTRKVNFTEESDRSDGRLRGARKPLSTFKGTLLHISPAEELSFGSRETERKCLIILSNVTKNHVAFKVRTTAPEKYRVKPSSSSCDPGASVDIIVSLHGGFQASLQDRFLIMAAEMEGPSSDLTQFWKEIQKIKIMEHRLRCHVLEVPKSILNSSYGNLGMSSPSSTPDLQTVLMQTMAASARLEQKVEQCVWMQKLLLFMMSMLVAYLLWTS